MHSACGESLHGTLLCQPPLVVCLEVFGVLLRVDLFVDQTIISEPFGRSLISETVAGQGQYPGALRM